MKNNTISILQCTAADGYEEIALQQRKFPTPSKRNAL